MFNILSYEKSPTKLGRIYNTYKNTMFAVALDITKSIDDAEDVVSESMVKVIGILDKISDDSIGTKKCRNLMITISRNTAIDCLRKAKRQAEVAEYERVEELPKSAEEIIIETENYNELMACIDGLDVIYREVMQLKLVYQLNSKEIVNILNISEANVNTRYTRGKQMLKKMLEERNNKVKRG